MEVVKNYARIVRLLKVEVGVRHKVFWGKLEKGVGE